MTTQKKSLLSSSKKSVAAKASAKAAASAKSVSAKKLANTRLAVNHNQTSLKPLIR